MQAKGALGNRLKDPWEWAAVLEQVSAFAWAKLDVRFHKHPPIRLHYWPLAIVAKALTLRRYAAGLRCKTPCV